MLNIPLSLVMELNKSKSILIMGMGGDYDFFSGLPLYFTLEKMGLNVNLASFTQSEFSAANNYVETIPMASGCVGVTGDIKRASTNFPEMYLSSWFKEVKQEDVTVWTFKRDQSVLEYSKSLNTLVKHLGVDTILLVDGGVDSIMIGDEDGSGKMFEDTLTLAAVKNVEIPNKFISCIGFGAEMEEGLSHYLALENIANISNQGGFYGTCSLVDYMNCFKDYKSACEHVWSQPDHRKSPIQTKIIPSAEGEFGDFHMFPMEKKMKAFISPLTSMYWFFNAEAAIYNNIIIPVIEDKETFYEAVQAGVPLIKNHILRKRKSIPLT